MKLKTTNASLYGSRLAVPVDGTIQIDRNGEILADSEDAARVGVVNLRHLPLLGEAHHSGSLANTPAASMPM